MEFYSFHKYHVFVSRNRCAGPVRYPANEAVSRIFLRRRFCVSVSVEVISRADAVHLEAVALRDAAAAAA